MTFFTNLLLKEGATPVFERYILSKDANLVPGPNTQEPPAVLSRYLGGFLHPLIHSGYGAEFSLLGIWAEGKLLFVHYSHQILSNVGLAEAYVQPPHPTALVPSALFDTLAPKATGLVSQFAKFALSPSTPEGKTSSVHALAILAKVASDPAFKPSEIGLPPPEDSGENAIQRVARVVGDKLVGFLNEWTVSTDVKDLEEKLEEVIWMNTLVYSVGGWGGREQGDDENKEFNGDFFL